MSAKWPLLAPPLLLLLVAGDASEEVDLTDALPPTALAAYKLRFNILVTMNALI